MADPTIVFPDTLTDMSSNTVKLFPATFSYLPRVLHATDVERAFDGGQQTRSRFQEFGFIACSYTTRRLDPYMRNEFRTTFLDLVRGRANRFWFTTPDEMFWTEKFVGFANGTANLDLNVRDAYAYDEVAVDGTPTVDYNHNLGGGTYGQDELEWTATPPSLDAVITMANVWARQVFIACMESDEEIAIPFAGGEDATPGEGSVVNPRLFVKYQLQIRGTK